ncbi:MAG: fibronectin type III domain-containing protein, partial [Gammaproteobacteria bacterium]|nr:fibronectin type III domain-containing protein [Gammaproteobacteria bacterium]
MVFTTRIRIIPVLFSFIFLTACTGDTPEPFPSPTPAQAGEVTQPDPVADPVVDPGDDVRPSIPMSLRAIGATSSQVSFAWNASSDNVAVTGYRLYKNGSTTPFASTAALSFTDTGLVANQTYQYRVTAIDGAGNESNMSASLTVNTLSGVDSSAPTTPSNLRASNVSSDQISIAWNASSDNVAVTGYRLYKNGSA